MTHEVLNAIEIWLWSIQETLNTAPKITSCSKLSAVKSALAQVKRHAPSVAAQKKELLALLGKLESCLGSQAVNNGPLQYDSCKFSTLNIDSCF